MRLWKLQMVIPVILILFGINSFAQFRNIKVNADTSGRFQPCEVAIAINPTNPNILAAGAVLDYLFLSTDAGETWSQTMMNSNFGVWGDPSLIFDKWGNLYYSHLSNPPSYVGYWVDRIVVQKSEDDGLSWPSVTGLGYSPPRKNQDKEWISADWTNSENTGNVYVAWTEFDNYLAPTSGDSTRILFSTYDFTTQRWTDPVRVSERGGDCYDDDNTVEGAVPAVGPDGEVYLSWAGPLGIMFDKSTNEGLTWGSDIFVNSMPGGWAMDVNGVPRCNGMPVTGCDISNSEYRGYIYINWADQRNGLNNPDIFIARSTDGGSTWSDATRVNNDNTSRPQFFPWMSVDPKTGFIYVVFYDRRNTIGNITDVYLARSKDGGENFENFKISESSFDFPVGFNLFFGDYNNIAAYDGKIYPIWTRIEVGDPSNSDDDRLNVMVALIDDAELITSNEKEINLFTEDRLYDCYPNPFNPTTNIKYSISKNTRVLLTVFDVLGRQVKILEDEVKKAGYYEIRFDAENIASGTYIYKLQAGSFSAEGKMLFLK